MCHIHARPDLRAPCGITAALPGRFSIFCIQHTPTSSIIRYILATVFQHARTPAAIHYLLLYCSYCAYCCIALLRTLRHRDTLSASTSSVVVILHPPIHRPLFYRHYLIVCLFAYSVCSAYSYLTALTILPTLPCFSIYPLCAMGFDYILQAVPRILPHTVPGRAAAVLLY
jgi:hypothetical protein